MIYLWKSQQISPSIPIVIGTFVGSHGIAQRKSRQQHWPTIVQRLVGNPVRQVFCQHKQEVKPSQPKQSGIFQ